MKYFSNHILALALALALCAQAATANAAPAAPQTIAFGSADGSLRIAAFWFPAASATDGAEPTRARPVVIGLHGCGGPLDANDKLSPFLSRYAAYFNAEGYHFLVPDSFSARGEKSICGTPTARRTITEHDRRQDVFAAMSWLATQPSVDMTRVVVVGWSHGAQTVLQVMDASDPFVASRPHQPVAAVAFYPGCFGLAKSTRYTLGAPMLLMTGELDNWTPARHCVAFHERMQPAAPTPFDLVVYPGSYHGFDSLSKVVERSGVGNTASGKAMVGGNPQAMRASHQRLFDFLALHSGMPLRLTTPQRLALVPIAVP